MLKETYETCVKPDGAYNGVPVGPEDVLELQVRRSGWCSVLCLLASALASAQHALAHPRLARCCSPPTVHTCSPLPTPRSAAAPALRRTTKSCRPRSASCWGPAAAWPTCAASTRGPRASLGCASPTERRGGATQALLLCPCTLHYSTRQPASPAFALPAASAAPLSCCPLRAAPPSALRPPPSDIRCTPLVSCAAGHRETSCTFEGWGRRRGPRAVAERCTGGAAGNVRGCDGRAGRTWQARKGGGHCSASTAG